MILKYILFHTVFQLSCSICQIITLDKGVPFVNTLVLQNLLEYLHHSYTAITAIMLFKVIQGHQFGTTRKLVCDFLLLINTDLHPISHHFQIIADEAHWSHFTSDGGTLLFSTLVRVNP